MTKIVDDLGIPSRDSAAEMFAMNPRLQIEGLVRRLGGNARTVAVIAERLDGELKRRANRRVKGHWRDTAAESMTYREFVDWLPEMLGMEICVVSELIAEWIGLYDTPE